MSHEENDGNLVRGFEWKQHEHETDADFAARTIDAALADQRISDQSAAGGMPLDESVAYGAVKEHLDEWAKALLAEANAAFGQERRKYVGAIATLNTLFPDEYPSLLIRIGTDDETLMALTLKGNSEQRRINAAKNGQNGQR